MGRRHGRDAVDRKCCCLPALHVDFTQLAACYCLLASPSRLISIGKLQWASIYLRTILIRFSVWNTLKTLRTSRLSGVEENFQGRSAQNGKAKRFSRKSNKVNISSAHKHSERSSTSMQLWRHCGGELKPDGQGICIMLWINCFVINLSMTR